jgi:nickel/cobalt transporter regulator
MRTLLISILLASAAASPALAQGHGRFQSREAVGSDHQERQQERQQAREQARAERVSADNAQRAQEAPPREDRSPRFETRQQRAGDGPRGGSDGPRFERANRDNVQAGVEPPEQVRNPGPRVVDNGFAGRRDRAERTGNPGPRVVRNRFDADNDRGGWTSSRNGWTRDGGDLRQSSRPVPNVMRDRNPLVVSNRPREGTQPVLRTDGRRWSGTNSWNHNWRNDGRYNWRDYRNRHRSTFHLGIYYDPFGWDYRPYQVGWRLWPGYYSSRYWIDDPSFYRLPYAPPGTRWIRYWDDAVLVDTFTGEVVDVIHNFFW